MMQKIGAAKEPIMVRHLTASRRQIYCCSETLMQHMSYPTWVRLLALHMPYVKDGHGKSDYCDHCHLYERSILPTMWSYLREVREHLVALYPVYFDQFDARPFVQTSACSYPSSCTWRPTIGDAVRRSSRTGASC